MVTELQRLTGIVNEVAAAVGFTESLPVKPTTYPPDAMQIPGLPMVGVSMDERNFIWVEGTLGMVSDYHLQGIVAHEIGHLMTVTPKEAMIAKFQATVLGNPKLVLQQELLADAFAAWYGYGPNLADSFRWTAEQFNLPTDRQVSHEHPSIDARIAVINSVIAERSKPEHEPLP